MIDDPWVVRDNEGRVLPDDEAEGWLERSRDRWIQHARFARNQFEAGIDVDFHRYQIGVRVGLARKCNHHLLAVKRHRRAVGFQPALF